MGSCGVTFKHPTSILEPFSPFRGRIVLRQNEGLEYRDSNAVYHATWLISTSMEPTNARQSYIQ